MVSAAPLIPGICRVIDRVLLQKSLLFFFFFILLLVPQTPWPQHQELGLNVWHLSPFPQNSEMMSGSALSSSPSEANSPVLT